MKMMMMMMIMMMMTVMITIIIIIIIISGYQVHGTERVDMKYMELRGK